MNNLEFRGTKGEWTVDIYRKIGELNPSMLKVGSTNRLSNYPLKICNIWDESAHRNDQNIDYEISLANAKLIAAAPDLLEALQNILSENTHLELDLDSVDKAEKAIEKALK